VITRNKTAAEVWEANKPRMMYCFAKYVYPRQNKATPSGKGTWGQRFRELYGRDYVEYTDEIRAHGRANQEKAK